MIDLITVVFREELPLLEIQARSINQYVAPEDIANIYVIVNDSDDVADLIDPNWWQLHKEKVQIKKYSQWNYISRVTGWESQQICKLLGASEAESNWSMVLDAKTWFVDYLNLIQLYYHLLNLIKILYSIYFYPFYVFLYLLLFYLYLIYSHLLYYIYIMA